MDQPGHSPEILEALKVAIDSLWPEEQGHKDADSVRRHIYSSAQQSLAIASLRQMRARLLFAVFPTMRTLWVL